MKSCKVPSDPFGKIALSCSGGGYRAATFHLGAMSYLNKLTYKQNPLLDKVAMISTVSGGTLTGIVYAIAKSEGKSFDEAYQLLFEQLQTIDLVKEGILKLNPGAQWQTPTKHKNLINAFSELYDQYLTKGRTIGDLRMGGGLECAVFNATEFSNAADFRFYNPAAGYTGNNYFQTAPETAAEIRLSDVMAASSCFPGGFEPIMWPDDFVHAGAQHLQALSGAMSGGAGLMDGGIYDNQGIQSILNYESRRVPEGFDLIIISDVASPYMQAYEPVAEGEKKGWNRMTIGEMKTKAERYSKNADRLLLAAVLIACLLPFAWKYSNSIFTGILIGVAASLAAVFILKKTALGWVATMKARALALVKKVVPKFYLERLANLDADKLSLHRVEPLLLDRLNSLLTLLLNVFLKVVRRLNYNVLYTDPVYTYRRVSNLVQELTKKDFDSKLPGKIKAASEQRRQQSLLLGTFEETVSPEIAKIAAEAASFGTTLWFTPEQQLVDLLGKLIVTGRVTMCYNMLEYLENIVYDPASGFWDLDMDSRLELTKTYERCKLHWLAFKENPDAKI